MKNNRDHCPRCGRLWGRVWYIGSVPWALCRYCGESRCIADALSSPNSGVKPSDLRTLRQQLDKEKINV